MSDGEKLSRLERDVKRWWPLILFIGGIIGFFFRAGMWATNYDNNVAKKSDIDNVSVKIDALNRRFESFSNDIRKHSHAADSERENVIALAGSNRRGIDSIKKRISYIETKHLVMYKWINGRFTFAPADRN